MNFVKCCKNTSRYFVVYDSGNGNKQKLELCEYHYYSDSAFQKHIIEIKEVNH